MTEIEIIQRFQQVVRLIVKNNWANNEGDVATAIGENNSQGLTDLKKGKKTLKVDHLTKMKRAFEKVNTLFILEDSGEPILEEIESRDLTSLLDQLQNEDQLANRKHLVNVLKQEIEALKTAKNESDRKLSQIKKKFNSVF